MGITMASAAIRKLAIKMIMRPEESGESISA